MKTILEGGDALLNLSQGATCVACGDVLHREFGWCGTWVHSDGLSLKIKRRLFGPSDVHFAEVDPAWTAQMQELSRALQSATAAYKNEHTVAKAS
jgi:hypothetical protein